MLDTKLADALGAERSNASPGRRSAQFAKLATQIMPQERESLYAAAKYAYTGEGDIWDIGSAAGGSSFCLAAGVQDGPLREKSHRVKCFDLFDGYSGQSFKERFPAGMSDLEIFFRQTAPVSKIVDPVKINLITELDGYPTAKPVEIAHIDAAKSLQLWQSIFRKISTRVIPEKTIWIFQDFDRMRLTWQLYSLAELLDVGQIIGGAHFGTVYFRFSTVIGDKLRNKIAVDAFSLGDRLDNVCKIFEILRRDCLSFCPETRFSMDDQERAAIAYCHYWDGDGELARSVLSNASDAYLADPANRIYLDEIVEANPV